MDSGLHVHCKKDRLRNVEGELLVSKPNSKLRLGEHGSIHEFKKKKVRGKGFIHLQLLTILCCYLIFPFP